jgi:predicted anti-sigma-YlaC factor YlaD
MRRRLLVLALIPLLAGSGCSVRQFAIRQLGSALAQGGGAFAQEDDVKLAGDAVPFSLKLVESLLLQDPENTDLLLAAASGYTQYAYGWVQQPADFLETENPAKAAEERARAARLYLRAHRYAEKALQLRLKGFTADRKAAFANATIEDVPHLYWHAASLGGAIALSKQDATLVARVPEIAASFDRAFELAPDWGEGTLHAFRISFEPARPGARDPEAQVLAAFDAAVRASQGLSAAPYVTLAETFCVARQDKKRFVELLNTALQIDLDRAPDLRLANRLYQERARWLLAQVDDLILE